MKANYSLDIADQETKSEYILLSNQMSAFHLLPSFPHDFRSEWLPLMSYLAWMRVKSK
jgi:hypothetical protein